MQTSGLESVYGKHQLQQECKLQLNSKTTLDEYFIVNFKLTMFRVTQYYCATLVKNYPSTFDLNQISFENKPTGVGCTVA